MLTFKERFKTSYNERDIQRPNKFFFSFFFTIRLNDKNDKNDRLLYQNLISNCPFPIILHILNNVIFSNQLFIQ